MQIKRCRHVDGEPFSFTINYLPVEIGTRVDPAVLKTVPLNTVFERDLKIPVAARRGDRRSRAGQPRGRRRSSAIPVLYPIMHVTRVMFTERDRAFEVVETFYRADKYHYSVNLSRVKRNGKWIWSQEARVPRPPARKAAAPPPGAPDARGGPRPRGRRAT